MALPFEAKKSLGQNFLNNPRVPEAMVTAAAITAADTVLEIGPGTGALTKAILATGAKVVAIEADERACDVLRETFAQEIADGRLVLVHADIRAYLASPMPELPQTYAVIANIPYYLSGFLFRTLLEHAHYPKTIVFLIQKELAERIARAEKESLLSLSVKAYGMPKYIKTVGRGNFSPSPKVDSAVVAVHAISHGRFATLSQELFFKILHIGFAGKRKQLLGALAKQYDRAVLQKVFAELGFIETIRAEDIPIEKWTELVERLAVSS